ncbi:MAG TPA: hypothetical protein VHL54_01215 [Actinomycetota bacterium]|nr:hypothetical protein [Actinomycetota bacterium]
MWKRTRWFVSGIGRPKTVFITAGVLVLVLITTLLFATTGFGQAAVKFSLEPADRFSEVVRSPEGHFLVLKADGSSIEVLRLDRNTGREVTEDRLSAAGTVDYLKLATQATAGSEGRTVGVAVSCPGGFAGNADDGQTEESRFRICPVKQMWQWFEIDGSGNVLNEPQVVPAGASGFLYASESFFVIGNALLLKDGVWHPISKVPGRQGDPWGSCATNRELYALYGNPGPRSLTGLESALPNPEPNYGLYRYQLDGALDNEWSEVPIMGLKEAITARLACSPDAAIVKADSAFISAAAPDRVIELPGKTSSLLLNLPSKLPVITYLIPPPPGEFRGTRRCAIIEESGREVISGSREVCYGVPWRTGDDSYITVLGHPQLDLELLEW